MFVKSNSTGKYKDKRLQLTRMTECSTCPKLLSNSTSKKDYERPQPIKIAQLLKQSESIKNIPQDSVRKRAQPERLGALSNKKNIKLNDKQTGTEMIPSNRCARRFLNFSKISTKITKNDNENENQSNKFEQLHNEVFKPNKKRSLLIPPNTIRERHLQECSQKNIRQSMIHMTLKKMDEINIDSKDEIKATDESLNVNINSAVSIENKQKCNDQKIAPSSNHLKSKFIGHSTQHFETSHVTPKISSFSMCKSLQQINNEDQVFMQNNSICEKFTPNKNTLKCNIFSKSKETDDCVQNLCNNLQDTVLVTSENMEHKSPEMIDISKDKIIRFKHDLKDLLTETEENVIKMRSMLTYIVGLFDKEITSNIQLRKGNITMVDKEVQVETCCKSAQYSEKKVPQVIVTDNVDNKENDGVQNMKKVSDNTADESFLELENQLNITHAKPMQNNSQLKTPKIKKKGKQKRPLREYMALKSNMNFLETPDGKKFRSLCQIDDVDKSVLNVTYISNKLLTDLQNLYSESPDS